MNKNKYNYHTNFRGDYMKKKTKNKMMWAAILGGMGVAGYMYMKKNPEAIDNMKEMAKDMAKITYNKLEDVN